MIIDLTRVLAELYGETSVLVALYDGQDRLRYANPAFRAAYHLDSTETPLWPDLMRRNFLARRGTVIRADDFEAWLTSTVARRGKTGFRAFETDLMDGRWLWMTETVQSDGWMLCIASDITALRADDRTVRQDRDRAIRAAETDELTGVSNRRTRSAGLRVISTCRRRRTAVASRRGSRPTGRKRSPAGAGLKVRISFGRTQRS